MTDTPAPAELLYGEVGADELYDDLADLIDRLDDELDDAAATTAVTVEVWTAHPPRHHAPTPAQLLDWIAEHTSGFGELDEDGAAAWADAASLANTAVAAAAEALLDAIADRVHYRMANELVRTHVITWENGKPHVDGAPA